jgi:hypothetical protein
MLENPFNRGVNHACFGLMMPRASVKVGPGLQC